MSVKGKSIKADLPGRVKDLSLGSKVRLCAWLKMAASPVGRRCNATERGRNVPTPAACVFGRTMECSQASETGVSDLSCRVVVTTTTSLRPTCALSQAAFFSAPPTDAHAGSGAVASWPLSGRFRASPALLWVAPRCILAWVAAGSKEAKQNLMAAAGSTYRTALIPHAYEVPVRTPLHVGC